jgi:uncharacterized protein (TIGR02145 family)
MQKLYFLLVFTFLVSCSGKKKEDPAALPKVIIESVESTSMTSATVKAKITSEGKSAVTKAGVAWGLNPNPTVFDNDKIASGFGSGAFTVEIDGLSEGVTYYTRSYAVNSAGTAYSEQRQMFAKAFTSNGAGVTDIDGNSYNTIILGNGQEWMKENLKTSKYRNGDNIPTDLPDSEWSSTSEGAYSIFGNDIANNTLYGKLYNWQAVNDSRGLCPTGWHVPTDGDWNKLEEFVGANGAGGKLKAVSELWNPPNTGAINIANFSALPGGQRASGGGFFSLNTNALFWTASENSAFNAWSRIITYQSDELRRQPMNKRGGYSVRCIKD